MTRRTVFLWLKILGGLTALGAIAAVIGGIWLWTYVVRVTDDLPAIEDLAQYEPPVMTRVHAGDGRLIAEYARESRVFVPIEVIPAHVKMAFLSAEDKNFYDHGGVDFMGTLRGGARSVLQRLRGDSGPLQSGSTITQQVAKNFKLSAEQTIERKVKEVALARRLEQTFSKDKILELYLNEIYLGRRSYGVASAALLYFGKSLDDLTLGEAAYLAALPKAPNNYNPITKKARAISRRNYVIGRMLANNAIDPEEADAAMKEDLVVVDRLEGATYQASEYFTEEVRRRVFSMYGEDELYDGGLSVRTTLDTRLQLAARVALREGLEAYDQRHGYRGPIDAIDPGAGWAERLASVAAPGDLDDWRLAVVLSEGSEAAKIGFLDGSTGSLPLDALAWARRVGEGGHLGPTPAKTSDAVRLGEVVLVEALADDRPGDYALRQIPEVNGAILAMDPFTGRVLAMVGGYSYRVSQFNRATQARRQPGSSFKPFVYAAALDRGKTPASMVLDAPYVSTNTGDGSFYKPTNYTERWYGLSTLRLGIEKSRNAMTVRLANEIGHEAVSEYGERLGVYDDLPAYESHSLGAAETTLWRMATGYSAFVNGGRRVEPTVLDRVQDRNGETIFMHDPRVCQACSVTDWTSVAEEPVLDDPRPQALDPVTAYQITSMLEGVVQRGTATSVKVVGKPLAGKTGTTNDFRDAWFVGFSPNLVVAVYVGFDTPKNLGEGESGGKAAAPIFTRFMEQALADQPAIPFRIPPGVRLVRIEPLTGALARPGAAGAILEAFRPGTEPNRYDAANDGGAGLYDQDSGVLTVARPDDPSLTIPDGAAITAPVPADPGALGAGDPTSSDAALQAILNPAPAAQTPEEIEARRRREEDELGGLQ